MLEATCVKTALSVNTPGGRIVTEIVVVSMGRRNTQLRPTFIENKS
jgi:hypothetical protein